MYRERINIRKESERQTFLLKENEKKRNMDQKQKCKYDRLEKLGISMQNSRTVFCDTVGMMNNVSNHLTNNIIF